MKEVSEFDTEAALIETLQGIFQGNDKTKVGSGFHGLIEGKYNRQGNLYAAEDILFTQDQAAVAIDFRNSHPLMIPEVTIYHTYTTAFFPIQVSGRVDGIEGTKVHDHKCKFRTPPFTEYLDSVQWKVYLDALASDIFQYNIFEVKDFDALIGDGPFIVDEGVSFLAHEPMICTRYESMQQEIISLLNYFLDYVHSRGLLQYLKPAIVDH
ncbi:hypothetical protein [Chitinophaga sp. YIM B06452]|uniref:hypothetical protein n=1 Tax=Chitinophaga sp. YIM B06452 TaxID=3082158 RepID=UPI0031FE821B